MKEVEQQQTEPIMGPAGDRRTVIMDQELWSRLEAEAQKRTGEGGPAWSISAVIRQLCMEGLKRVRG